MRRFLRYLLLKPVLWAAAKFSSKPDKQRIFEALDKLYADIKEHPGKKGVQIPFELDAGRIVIFSDQHKGARNGADDFTLAEPNYLAALQHYWQEQFMLICLGDSEELWENMLGPVKKYNEKNFEAEKKFLDRDQFVKVIGNHDLYWTNDPLAWWQLNKIWGKNLKAYDGLILSTRIAEKTFDIFCTHGHQGDAQSDGNWFSKFFVARIWAPLQAFLRINPNTAAYDNEKKTLHNEMMYEWSSHMKDGILITGHTHQPVFASLTLIERLYKEYQFLEKNKNAKELEALTLEIRKREKEFAAVAADYLSMKPSYFNSGCCCFVDGDITGIEIDRGQISLVKWTLIDETPQRVCLETKSLVEVASVL